ncbi:hypothetical protein PR048_003019 [Dryococelus australis]|uniref:Uncharacterized protein n=1 Tax=Dryococelus australis TaxID=614101 RepID=A0ABQ9INA4_9NEOP|nr:hypothetical protein PR048_003019 [Dryococelus australis]
MRRWTLARNTYARTRGLHVHPLRCYSCDLQMSPRTRDVRVEDFQKLSLIPAEGRSLERTAVPRCVAHLEATASSRLPCTRSFCPHEVGLARVAPSQSPFHIVALACVFVSPVLLPRFLTLNAQVHRTLNLEILRADEGVSEVGMGQRGNARAGETGDPRENTPTSDIVRHDSHMQKSRSEPVGNRTRFALTIAVFVDGTRGVLHVWHVPAVIMRNRATHHRNYLATRCWILAGERAAVAERLACSPPTKVVLVKSPAASLPNFHTWESCRTMSLIGGFSRLYHLCNSGSRAEGLQRKVTTTEGLIEVPTHANSGCGQFSVALLGRASVGGCKVSRARAQITSRHGTSRRSQREEQDVTTSERCSRPPTGSYRLLRGVTRSQRSLTRRRSPPPRNAYSERVVACRLSDEALRSHASSRPTNHGERDWPS